MRQVLLTVVDACLSLERFDPQFWLPLLTFACVTTVVQGLVANRLVRHSRS